MRKLVTRLAMVPLLASIALIPIGPASGQEASLPATCQRLAFSVEEDFLMTEGEPADGNPYISDGDLLSWGNTICARNAELLNAFDVSVDLGLDAADVITTTGNAVAFSTELDSPNPGQFTAGDLLISDGSRVPNTALTAEFGVAYDIGLDAVHFVGKTVDILAFLDDWSRDPGDLSSMLLQREIDIWFSTEGTWDPVGAVGFLDGDLLSARDGAIIAPGKDLLPAVAPAGIPSAGVDFGLDGASGERTDDPRAVTFSTEILYQNSFDFTDGDILQYGSTSIVYTNHTLIDVFKPAVRFLGLDALSSGVADPLSLRVYLPVVLRASRAPTSEVKE